MYHPLNKITCPPLNKLNDLARLTLQFSLTQTLNLAEDQIRQQFIQHFIANGFPKAGAWLWGKPILIRQHVLALLPLTVVEKQDIFNVYVQNQELDQRFATGNFIPIPRPPVSDPAHDSAAELANNFYKILGEGVPKDVINESEPLDRQTVLRAYLDAQRNIHLKVCPGCDGKPPSIADGVIHEDLDHFFPKSKYPFLSIHPLNLTPFCKDCNQTYKRTKDAILDNDPLVVDIHNLHDIYHPYENPARDHLLIEIKENAEERLSFFFSSGTVACLHSLQYTLNLEERWTGDLLEERTEEVLSSLLLFASQEERNGDFQPTQDWLNQQLAIAVNTLSRKLGHQPTYVSALTYIKWVASNLKAQNIWLERVRKEYDIL